MREQPHFKRSALWQREREITAWVQEGYSFRQIADELSRQGVKVGTRWLQEWYAKNVGRRRARARDDTHASLEAGNPSTPRAAEHSSPAPTAPPRDPTAPAPEPDVTALFQSQFKRPRR